MAQSKEVKRLVQKAKAQGWRVDRTPGKQHWRFTPPDKSVAPAITSGTPSDWRSWNNFVADLRRKGFKFDGLGAACVGGRSDPDLWERAKRDAVRKLGGRHSARAMQEAGRIYRQRGGDYCGPKTGAQRRLSKWTREDWTTATGEKACRVDRKTGETRCDRYLPRAAWSMLSPREIAETRKKKLRSRAQYVPNAPAARRAGRRARRG